MPVVVGLVAIGVALLCLLLAYALTVVVTPIIEGALKQVPVVGGSLAGKAKQGVEWARAKIVAYAATGLALLGGWFGGLADSVTDFVAAVNAYLVELPDTLDHLLHVSVHEIVHSFVDPVRATANYAKQLGEWATEGVTDVYTHPLSDFQGIEHGVRDLVDHLGQVLRNVDLPELERTVTIGYSQLADVVAGGLADTTHWAEHEFGRVWGRLDDIPLRQILEGLAAAAGTAALVDLLARESGLDRSECRSKVRAICSTDPAAWQALLDIAGIALVFGGLTEFVQLAQELWTTTLEAEVAALHGR